MTTPRMPDPPVTERSSPESPIDAATILEEAADLLLIHGRGRRQSVDPVTGAFCAIHAMNVACRGDWSTSSVAQAAVRARVGTGVSIWNLETEADDEVRDSLLLAAKDLRNTAVPS